MSRSDDAEMDRGRVIRNTIIACRVPEDFKLQMVEYAADKDLSVSQLIRMGVRMVMKTAPVVPGP